MRNRSLIIAAICGMSLLAANSCRDHTKSASTNSPSKQPQQIVSAKPNQEESCGKFVQVFYDWYINSHLKDDKHHAWFDVVKEKPLFLSPQLRDLLKREDVNQTATGEIGVLDFDPFLAAQDWNGAYKVRSTTVNADHCYAQVSGSINLRQIELVQINGGWIFVNFDYSSYSADDKTKDSPDYDLVQLFVAKHGKPRLAKHLHL